MFGSNDKQREVIKSDPVSEISTNRLEYEDTRKSSRGNPQKRIMLTLGVMAAAIIACNTEANVVPTSQSSEANVSAPADIDIEVFPTATAFQPALVEEDPAIILPTQTLESEIIPVIEEAVEAPPIEEKAAEDPFFISNDSFILRNPTQVVRAVDEEYVELVTNSVLDRLVTLGIIPAQQYPEISIKFKSGSPGYICKSTGREIKCFDNAGAPYLQPDVSLISVHELLHLIGEIPNGTNIAELLADSAQYIMSGKDPFITDLYLFESEQLYNGDVVHINAREFVEMLNNQGFSDSEILRFIFNYNRYDISLVESALARELGLRFPQNGSPTFFDQKAQHRGLILSTITKRLLAFGPTYPYTQDVSLFRSNVFPNGEELFNAIQLNWTHEFK